MADNFDFPISDSRDPNRTPMQWDASVSAGMFTIGEIRHNFVFAIFIRIFNELDDMAAG